MRIAEMFLIKYFNLHFKVSHFLKKIYLFIYFILKISHINKCCMYRFSRSLQLEDCMECDYHLACRYLLGILTFNGNVLLASSPICGVTHQLHMASLLIFLIVLHEIRPLLSPLTTERK